MKTKFTFLSIVFLLVLISNTTFSQEYGYFPFLTFNAEWSTLDIDYNVSGGYDTMNYICKLSNEGIVLYGLTCYPDYSKEYSRMTDHSLSLGTTFKPNTVSQYVNITSQGPFNGFVETYTIEDELSANFMLNQWITTGLQQQI